MKEAKLPYLWDNRGMKRRYWCYSYRGLYFLSWLWDLWCFSTADRWGFRGKRGVRQEQGALFGDCYVLVCIKVVSPRGSNQEYSQGVLGTLSTREPRGSWRGADTERCRRARTDQEPWFWAVVGLFWFLAVCNCKGVFGLDRSLTPRSLSPDALLSRCPWVIKDVGEMTVSVMLAITRSSWR